MTGGRAGARDEPCAVDNRHCATWFCANMKSGKLAHFAIQNHVWAHIMDIISYVFTG